MADTSHYAHCRTLMEKLKRTHIRRFMVLAILLVLNFYVHVLTFGVKYAGPAMEVAAALKGEVGLSMLPFGMGMAALICSIAALALAIFAEAKRPKLTVILLVLIVLCAFADFIQWILAGIIVVMYAIQIKDIMNYRWLKEQPGFPHFSERFEEQLENSDYKPLHQMDNIRDGEMTGLSEDEADYSLQFSSKPDEMPGISDIALPEPESAPLPEITEHPVPDPVTDTSSILSDPMSDFPDLPDIPDIPTL